jgi:hypothetical protein
MRSSYLYLYMCRSVSSLRTRPVLNWQRLLWDKMKKKDADAPKKRKQPPESSSSSPLLFVLANMAQPEFDLKTIALPTDVL